MNYLRSALSLSMNPNRIRIFSDGCLMTIQLHISETIFPKNKRKSTLHGFTICNQIKKGLKGVITIDERLNPNLKQVYDSAFLNVMAEAELYDQRIKSSFIYSSTFASRTSRGTSPFSRTTR